ncbi:hypothetical protein [Nitrosomonas sp.]|uniref:hypothetical protein n=1 Tax=Nitrosomonas sp. TaxID=42353 RepID=UPI0025F3CE82|nr:hypothetical protein [Nitrosomonas sp.]MBY0483479.1 hypothetical protein [Nitrosomonas sp.]
MNEHPQKAKSLSDAQIAEIKRIVNGKSTSRSGLCWMYGITEEQLDQVLAHK